jgi:two-component system secretion response regulator SsrB
MMHQAAHKLQPHRPLNSENKTRVLLLLANTLDSEMLSRALGQHPALEMVACLANADLGMVRCQQLLPSILVLDPKASDTAVPQATALIQSQTIRHLLLLDDRLHAGRLAALLPLATVSYVTRQAGFAPLLSGLLQIASTGKRFFDPVVAAQISRRAGKYRLDRPHAHPSLALLTARELQVMTLLAKGYSVRRCAQQLGLAESTIDNHKSRLMKKLDIHKVVELTHLAIREGLIVV